MESQLGQVKSNRVSILEMKRHMPDASLYCVSSVQLSSLPCNHKYHMASQLGLEWNGNNNRVSTLEKWRQMPDGAQASNARSLYWDFTSLLHCTDMCFALLHCTWQQNTPKYNVLHFKWRSWWVLIQRLKQNKYSNTEIHFDTFELSWEVGGYWAKAWTLSSAVATLPTAIQSSPQFHHHCHCWTS